MKRLLFIFNDVFLERAVVALFTYHFKITSASSLDNAREKIEKTKFSLIVLQTTGTAPAVLECINEITETSFESKLLVLTDAKTAEERVAILEAGADDCLSKPISLVELKLKIKKLLSMEKLLLDEVIRLGAMTFYPDSGHLILCGNDIWLRKREAEILYCLLRYRNQVVTREKIITSVWSNSADLPVSTTLDVYIRRIRVLLREHSMLISTIRGFGYRFNDSFVRTQ
ncbi:response regulator transcription factor [Candidatus Woesebacteria bacterium]|nr:response regulator transcription factor [Candidatus Woesebacteria bacterium]